MDWYQDKNGNTMWQKGSEDVDGYKNIGANYTQNIGNGASITYTQNEATSMSFATLSESDWETQAYKGADGKIKWDGCKKTSDKMIAKADATSNKNGEIITTTGDSNGVVNGKTGNLDSGVKRMNSTLENGKPVEVGVDWKAKQTHNFKKNGGDGMTDHFIVIMGKTETLNNGAVQGTSYRFFDPGTQVRSNGVSKYNTLSVTNGYLKGSYLNGRKKYTVTTIRKTH